MHECDSRQRGSFAEPALQPRANQQQKKSHIWKSTLASYKMVQTKAGSRNNPWLEHLRQCAAEYHKRRAAEHASSSEEHREDEPIRRRVIGKRTEAKATTTPPKDTANKS